MEYIIYVECRQTGSGAYTSVDGKVVQSSKTGNHWVEKVVLQPGKKIPVVDVSNSGKHRCYLLSIDESGTEIKDYNEDIECSVCSSRALN